MMIHQELFDFKTTLTALLSEASILTFNINSKSLISVSFFLSISL